jgi:hypothetical protein
VNGKPDYTRRGTLHEPVQVITYDRNLRRDTAVIIHGEPACGSPVGAGTTTVLRGSVNCAKCLALLEAK